MKKIYIFPFLFLFLMVSFSSQAQDQGGPDAYGYTWVSSKKAGSGLNPQWIDLSKKENAADITNKFGDLNNNYGPLNFSFDFPYYGNTFKALYINGGGAVSFYSGPYGEPYPVIPQAGGIVDNYIAAFLTNLTVMDIDGGRFPDSRMYYWTDFKDSVVVSWHNVRFFNGLDVPVSSPPNLTNNSFQIIMEVNGDITFQYAKQEGSQQSCQSGGVCISVGIENINGTSGLHIKKGSGSNGDPASNYFAGVTEQAPIQIKITPPEESEVDFFTQDLALVFIDNARTAGKWIPKDATQPKTKIRVANNGTIGNDPNAVLVVRLMKEGSLTPVIPDQQILIGTIPPLSTKDFMVNVPIPTDVEAKYYIIGNINFTEDAATSNNRKNLFIGVVDTTKATIKLKYSDNNPETYRKWNGADDDQLGYACYYEPPFYPAKIKQVEFDISSYDGISPPKAPVVLRIFANDGLNPFGERDGTAGTKLFEVERAVGSITNGINIFSFPDTIQVNSGGVYVGMFFKDNTTQGVDTYMGQDRTLPMSYNAYFARFGIFQESFDREETDPAVGIGIGKGDLSKVVSLAITNILSPDSSQEITSSSDVTIELTNIGPKEIKDSFEVFYKVNNQSDVKEVVKGITIASGAKYTHTFTTKAPRPPVPAVKYKSFCAGLFLANDFVLSDNKICFGTEVVQGMEEADGLSRMRLYPNPTSNFIHFQFNHTKGVEEATVKVLDLQGKTVLTKNVIIANGLNDQRIDIGKLENGMYMMMITTDSNHMEHKFIISR